MRRIAACVALAALVAGGCSDDHIVVPDASAGVGRDLALGGGGSDGDGGGGAGDLAASRTAYVYVSGYSPTIARYLFDRTTGTLTVAGTTTTTGTPSFLAVDPAVRHLYAVDEQNSKVQAFAIDQTSGALAHLGVDQPSGGSGPAHVAVDGSGKWVLAANYGSGQVGILRIAADGSVGAPSMVTAGSMAHETVLDATSTHAWVPCLGANYVAQYAFAAANGTLTPLSPATVAAAAAGAGPRHLALHQNGQWAFLVEETASMIDVYTVDAGGHLALLQRQSSRAAGASGSNTAAEVQVHPSGQWVYVSNRGDDDIGIFAVGSDGKLTPLAHTRTGGQTPRQFSLDPAGRWLLVANQMSGDVRLFSVDGTTGLITQTSTTVAATMPSFVGVVLLP